MITYQGVVSDIQDTQLILTVSQARRSACGGCPKAESCFSDLFSPSTFSQRIKKPQHQGTVKIGDVVTVEMPENAYWKGLLFVYLVPTLLALLGMVLVQPFLPEGRFVELGMLGMAFVGIALGLAIARWQNSTYRPKIRVIDTAISNP